MECNAKLAAVTGASQGLGQGISLRLAEAGYDLALLDLKESTETERTITDNGGTAKQYHLDVTDEDGVGAAFQEIAAAQGTPVALVNAAGIFLDKPFLETTVEEWDKIMAVNVCGPFQVGKEAARRMKEVGGGAIVNILSNASVQGFAGESAYCASKGGILLLTRTMAVELARYGITVNGVGPGTSQTPMGGDYLGAGPIADHELSRTPLGRWGTPADIAEAVAFFVAQSTWVTGQALYVDGGFLATGLPVLEEA